MTVNAPALLTTDLPVIGPDGFRLPGTPYLLLAPLGEGGMGQVFRAEHVELARPVALKLLSPQLANNAEALERLRREARATARLGNPHIIDVYDLGVSEDGRPYVAMRLVEGRSLKALHDAEAPLDPARVVRLIAQISSALSEVHAVEVVHRDLKPENIMIEQRRGEDHAIVLDFGIAQSVEDSDTRLTREGQVIGTPGYMAPEQALSRPLDGRADQYSLAVIAYELLSRGSPYDRVTPLQVIAAQLTQPPRDLASLVDLSIVPPEMCAVVMRAASRERDARFATVAEFSQALAASLSAREAPAVVRPDRSSILSTSQIAALPRRAKVGWAAAIGIGAALAAGVGIWVARQPSTSAGAAGLDAPRVEGRVVIGETSPVEPVALGTPSAPGVAPPERLDAGGSVADRAEPGAPSGEERVAAARAAQDAGAAARPPPTIVAAAPKQARPEPPKPRPTRGAVKRTGKRPPATAAAEQPERGAKVEVATGAPGERAPAAPAAVVAAPEPAPPLAAAPPVAEPPRSEPSVVAAARAPLAAAPPPPSAPPRLVIQRAQIEGGSSARPIQAQVERNSADIRACVKGLSGLKAGDKATVRFVVDDNGFFERIEGGGHGGLAGCGRTGLRAARLSRPPDTGNIRVSFVLEMVEGGR